MKRKTNNLGRAILPYESPDFTFVEIMTEGLLCGSVTLTEGSEITLDDYAPSNGAW